MEAEPSELAQGFIDEQGGNPQMVMMPVVIFEHLIAESGRDDSDKAAPVPGN